MRLRLRLLRVLFLFIIPALAVGFAIAFFALLFTRPSAALTDADIEATVQARVQIILSDRPQPTPPPAAAPAVPGGAGASVSDHLSDIVASIGQLITALLASINLAGVGESIANLLSSLWAVISGAGVLLQLACCCLAPLAGLIALIGIAND